MMLAHVRDAIDGLNREVQNGISTPCNSDHDVDTKEVQSEVFSWLEQKDAKGGCADTGREPRKTYQKKTSGGVMRIKVRRSY